MAPLRRRPDDRRRPGGGDPHRRRARAPLLRRGRGDHVVEPARGAGRDAAHAAGARRRLRVVVRLRQRPELRRNGFGVVRRRERRRRQGQPRRGRHHGEERLHVVRRRRHRHRPHLRRPRADQQPRRRRRDPGQRHRRRQRKDVLGHGGGLRRLARHRPAPVARSFGPHHRHDRRLVVARGGRHRHRRRQRRRHGRHAVGGGRLRGRARPADRREQRGHRLVGAAR